MHDILATYNKRSTPPIALNLHYPLRKHNHRRFCLLFLPTGMMSVTTANDSQVLIGLAPQNIKKS